VVLKVTFFQKIQWGSKRYAKSLILKLEFLNLHFVLSFCYVFFGCVARGRAFDFDQNNVIPRIVSAETILF
jgi:hypothetical protein